MFKPDAQEATGICDRVLKKLLTFSPTRGRSGSDLRTAVGDFLADAQRLLQADEAGPPLDNIFELARNAGVTQASVAHVRATAALEAPKTVGATIVKNALIQFSLATEARIIADTVYVSRNDVEAVRDQMNAAYAPMEEIAADDMAQMTYRALVELHAALAFHLTRTARPLPRMLTYMFNQALPTLVTAYRLYADAGRADELRTENKTVHPAFMLPSGRALSS